MTTTFYPVGDIAQKTHNNTMFIIFSVLTAILLIISVYGIIAYFFEIWPYKKTKNNTTNNTNNNTTNTNTSNSKLTKKEIDSNTKFNKTLLYVSIAIAVIAVFLLLVIIIVANVDKTKKVTRYKRTIQRQGIPLTRLQKTEEIAEPSDRPQLTGKQELAKRQEVEKMLLLERIKKLEEIQQDQQSLLAKSIVARTQTDPEKIAAEELFTAAQQKSLSKAQLRGMERALQTKALADIAINTSAPSATFSRGQDMIKGGELTPVIDRQVKREEVEAEKIQEAKLTMLKQLEVAQTRAKK